MYRFLYQAFIVASALHNAEAQALTELRNNQICIVNDADQAGPLDSYSVMTNNGMLVMGPHYGQKLENFSDAEELF